MSTRKIPNSLCSVESRCVFLWVAVILPVIAETLIVLWHNCLVVPNRGVGGKGRGNICGPPGGRFQRAAKLAAK